MNSLEKIRQENPLVVCYTNDVVKNFTANGLLSIGASPAMSEAPEEAEEFYKVAGALLINIGTLTKANEKDILEIGSDKRQIIDNTRKKTFVQLLLRLKQPEEHTN